MKCAFTICTYSYLGLAYTLKDSFMKFNKFDDFYIIVVDDVKDKGELVLADDVLSQYVSTKDIEKMKFQYDVTEYSTSIKPFAIRYYLSKGYELVAYLDPDIQFYSEFKELNNDKYCAYVTPHIEGMNDLHNADSEANIMKHGLFNCGFIAFRNLEKSLEFLKWWSDRLIDYAFDDLSFGIYTDQKWIDFITIYMNKKLCIIQNPGCNLAVWNLNNRILLSKNEGYKVSNNRSPMYDLVFVHYSGFDYGLLCSGKTEHKFYGHDYYHALEPLLLSYGQELNKRGHLDYVKYKYKYNYFSNNCLISKFHRRLFREIIKDHYIENPFAADGELYRLLDSKGCITVSKSEPSMNNISNLNRKIFLLRLFFRITRKILGNDRYLEFLKALNKFSSYEHQIFLIRKDNPL